jgi:hypothetical protein
MASKKLLFQHLLKYPPSSKEPYTDKQKETLVALLEQCDLTFAVDDRQWCVPLLSPHLKPGYMPWSDYSAGSVSSEGVHLQWAFDFHGLLCDGLFFRLATTLLKRLTNDPTAAKHRFREAVGGRSGEVNFIVWMDMKKSRIHLQLSPAPPTAATASPAGDTGGGKIAGAGSVLRDVQGLTFTDAGLVPSRNIRAKEAAQAPCHLTVSSFVGLDGFLSVTMIAANDQTHSLCLSKEAKEIKSALEKGSPYQRKGFGTSQADIDYCDSVCQDEFIPSLTSRPPLILHLAAHGTDAGMVFADPPDSNGKLKGYSLDDAVHFCDYLNGRMDTEGKYNGGTRGVVCNCCLSKRFAKTLFKGCPHLCFVVFSKKKLSDKAAVASNRTITDSFDAAELSAAVFQKDVYGIRTRHLKPTSLGLRVVDSLVSKMASLQLQPEGSSQTTAMQPDDDDDDEDTEDDSDDDCSNKELVLPTPVPQAPSAPVLAAKSPATQSASGSVSQSHSASLPPALRDFSLLKDDSAVAEARKPL